MLSKILCVDDDAITLMLCKKVISKAEFSKEIDTAINGEKALLYLESIIEDKEKDENTIFPELIFLDLNMPVMNGWEFLDVFSTDKYSKVFKDTKVIVLSSTIDPKDIEKSKSYSMVINFLSKPITLEILKSIELK